MPKECDLGPPGWPHKGDTIQHTSLEARSEEVSSSGSECIESAPANLMRYLYLYLPTADNAARAAIVFKTIVLNANLPSAPATRQGWEKRRNVCAKKRE